MHLLPGGSATVEFTVTSADLRVVDRATGDTVSTPGTFTLRATDGHEQALDFDVRVVGSEVVVERFPGR